MKKAGFFALAVAGTLVFPVFASAQYYAPYNYYGYDYYYDRYDDDVFCTPQNQTVVEGQRAYFVAYGGDGDYDWRVEGRTYRDAGRRFSHTFDDSGRESVRVTSDGESDTCYVEVVDRYGHYPYAAYPAAPIYTQPVNITTTYIPQTMPNTGFPPVSSAALAFAAVMLFGVGLALTPYAKKAFTAFR